MWLARRVEEFPDRFERAALLIPCALRPQHNGTKAGVRIKLHDLVEILRDASGPFLRRGFLYMNFNAHAGRGFRVVIIADEVNVVLCESGSALTPAPRERDAQRIQDRRFPSVVRTHEHRGFPQVDGEMPYRAEVADLDSAHAHY